ncbi:MAG TPA: M1 family aminopeptidase, partial [Acidimicrobiales bacterium]
RGKSEVDDPASRPAAPGGTLTWRFTADSVRDFAWAAARHFIWDAVGANGGKVLVMSFYPASADSIWNRASEYGKLAIERYSKQWWPYPYPMATNVNGIEDGMEYPMIVFCHNRTQSQRFYGVTDHEFGHTWFPMLVGSNERLYAWQDEGFNTFMNYYNWEQQYPGLHNRRGGIEEYLEYAKSGRPQETIMTPPDRLHDVGQLGYNKPALGLRLLRDVVLGQDRFDPAFREYMRRWAYKHPTPADFFRTIEDGVGEDLSWFWQGWFYTNGTLDQAVDSVTVSDSAGVASWIYLRNAGAIPMPVDLALTLGGGGGTRLKLPVEIWFHGDRYVAVVPGDVTGVRVDPDSVLPDIDRGNNEWPRPRQ